MLFDSQSKNTLTPFPRPTIRDPLSSSARTSSYLCVSLRSSLWPVALARRFGPSLWPVALANTVSPYALHLCSHVHGGSSGRLVDGAFLVIWVVLVVLDRSIRLERLFVLAGGIL